MFSTHSLAIYIKQDIRIMQGMVVLFISEPYCNVHQFSSLIKQIFYVPKQHISISLVKLFCCRLATLLNIHLLILPDDDLLYSLVYNLLNIILFIFLHFINFVKKINFVVVI